LSNRFDIDVVVAHLADWPDLNPFAAVLAGDERDRAGRFKVSEARDVFTLAHGLLRFELSERTGVAPNEVHFDVRSSGKPDVRPGPHGTPDWRFNISHTGPHIVIAFALGVDVGIDIERLDRKVAPLEIARRYFTPAELKQLEALPEAARERAFFAGWTRKEAIVKARGATMAESLATLTVSLNPSAAHPDYEDLPTAPARPPCRLAAFELRDHDLFGAVALQSDRTPELRFRVPSRPGVRLASFRP
jgi:4'-phosphopantetheinyl transferase